MILFEVPESPFYPFREVDRLCLGGVSLFLAAVVGLLLPPVRAYAGLVGRSIICPESAMSPASRTAEGTACTVAPSPVWLNMSLDGAQSHSGGLLPQGGCLGVPEKFKVVQGSPEGMREGSRSRKA